MIGRWLGRLADAQGRWSRPLGDAAHGILHPLFQRLPALRDLLNGRWLGHPLHAASTDIPIGILLLVTVFDVLGSPDAARVALVVGLVAMSASAVSGLADFADTDGRARERATVHATLMVVAYAAYAASLVMRLGEPSAAIAPWLAVLGSATILGGASVGGSVVYVLGNMVSRHAFRGPGTKWLALEPTGTADDGDIPQGRPIRARLGLNHLVLVREGERILALHDTCAHAGGPLPDGRLVDGAIECPWHGSRFDLGTGRVRRGPSVYDQPAYEVRRREGGGWEARRRPAGGG